MLNKIKSLHGVDHFMTFKCIATQKYRTAGEKSFAASARQKNEAKIT